MLYVMGVIDGIRIFITKLVSIYSKGYFFHKMGGYNLNVVSQVVVDNQKMFMDIYV